MVGFLILDNNLRLDHIRGNNKSDFKEIYEGNDATSEDGSESPLTQIHEHCEYYEPKEFNIKCDGFQSSTSYFHINTCSLSKKWDPFRELICELQSEKFSFDFIGVSEVFATCNKDSRIHLPGFHDIITRTRSDGVRGGVGLFINENINFKIREDLSIFMPHVFESIFVEIIANSGSNSIVAVIYRPNVPPLADLDIFTTTLLNIMDTISTEKKHCVLMGDFNIDLLKYNTNDRTNDFIDNIFSQGFLPLIHKPTRITDYSETLIDHIYSNNLLAKSTSGIIITDLSDHLGIYHIVKNKSRNHKEHVVTKRILSLENQLKFNQLLEQTDFSSILNMKCPEEAYNNFFRIYKTSFDLAFPPRQIKCNKKFTKKEPWMTEGLLTSMRKKSNLFHKKLKKPTEHNIETYKTYVNKYNKLKREMKKNYFINMLEVNKTNIKNTWQILKKAIGKTTTKTNFPQTFSIENEQISNKAQIAQSFNMYFSNIGKLTSQNVPQSKKKFSEFLTNPLPNSMYLEPINKTHVLDVVNKLKPKTSFGHDEIPTKVVKASINSFLDPITHIINLSLSTGIIPSQLKKAKVIPIYKTSRHDLMKNYRPISLLPSFSKIFEKIMFNKIMSFLNSQNILYKHQYGFRPKHSTIHPVLHLLSKCAEFNNTQPKKYTMSIFCDLSKAFDVINHEILIKKLEYYGIRGIVKDWILNYLSDRTQFVQFENCKSGTCIIEFGVPQGSILGPLLFLLYVNDIAESTTGNILSFADDTSLFFGETNIQKLYKTANIEVGNLYDWFCANKLSLNASKTKFIVLRPSYQKIDFTGLTVRINGVQLSQIGKDFDEQYTKFLGVNIDEHLSWKFHLKHINTKISRALFMIKQVKHFLPTESLKTLYYSMIHPYITYGILAWGNAGRSEIKKTYLLQKRAIRIINKSSYNSHTDPLFKKSCILKVEDQYVYQATLFMQDYATRKLPVSFIDLFKYNYENQVNRETRQYFLMSIDRCDSIFASNLPLYNFPKLWNSWIRSSKTDTSKPNFFNSQIKLKMKETFLSSYASTVKCSNIHCVDCT